jgi:hypothetical protein
MKNLIEELGLEGKGKGERTISLIQSSLFAELELIKDGDEEMVNLVRLGLMGYEVEGNRKRMN